MIHNRTSISCTCGLLGFSRQVYYRSLRSKGRRQVKAEQVITMVASVRRDMPRIGFRKLYCMLHDPLRDIQVGRDKFLAILKANHMLIKPKRNYRITINFHPRFHKHKNLVENRPLQRPEQVWGVGHNLYWRQRQKLLFGIGYRCLFKENHGL
jgi:putative transposase